MEHHFTEQLITPAAVLAIDPGGTTGIAVLPTWQSLGPDVHAMQVTTGKELWELLHRYQPQLIVYELFKLYAHKANTQIGNEFPSAQQIGIIRLYVELHPECRAQGQMASQAKLLVTDAALRDLELVRPKQPAAVHARDAMRHLVYYMITQKPEHPWRTLFGLKQRPPKEASAKRSQHDSD